MHVWMDAPLTTRVTLNMKDYGGREVGLSAKSFEVQHVSSTHLLTQGSCIAQDGAFDGRAVGGAPGAIFIYGAITNTL